MEKKGIKKYFLSIQGKIQLLSTIPIFLFIVGFALYVFLMIYTSQLKLSKSYLIDQANSYGTLLEYLVENDGEDILYKTSKMTDLLGGVRYNGISSSYAYLVSENRMVLYHPTTEKIGQPVENVVVDNLVSEINAGKKVEVDCVEYEYKGKVKYASYYISKQSKFILVIAADKADVFAEIYSVEKKIALYGIIIMLSTVIVALFVARGIVKPLDKVTKNVQQIGSLDLISYERESKLSKRSDEVGTISRAIDNLHNELIQVVSGIKNQSIQLSESSNGFNQHFEEIAESITNVNIAVEGIAQGSNSQALETTEASQKVMEMGQAVDRSSQSIYQLEKSSNKMKDFSDKAKTSLEELISITNKTKVNIAVVSKEVNETNDSAKQINEAIRVIQDIAEQTSLLSLNASIEAARAGEAGRGFAVVAEEIRHLSESSNESAKVIDDVVHELMKNSQESVECINEAEHSSDIQLEKLNETNHMYHELESEVIAVSTASIEIAKEIERINELGKTVDEVVHQLAAISEESAASTEETSSSIQALTQTIEECKAEITDLYQMSQSLNEEASRFKS